MDTQSLEAFLAVAEAGSFSAAAERLHLTQPAVSKRIAALEHQLDTRLFDRIGRQPRLTEAGQALLPRAQRILLDVRAARRAIEDLHGSVAGTLALGISHHLGLHRLPPLLADFSRRYPQVRLDIEFLDSEEAAERVLAGELELSVGTLPPEPTGALQQRRIWHDELVVAVAPDHPLTLTLRVQQVVELAELSRHTAIIPGLHSSTGGILQKLFREAGLPLDVGMSTHYLETIKMMVAIGLGWSILPRTLIDDSVRPLTLRDRPLSRELGCQTHHSRSLSNAARAFIELLESAADL